MTIRSLIQAATLAAALVLPLAFPMNGAAAAQCEAQINQALREMSVPQDDVKSVKVLSRSRGAKSPTNYMLDAWIRLKTCNGYVMVNMTRHCVVQQSYTTGDCKVGNLPNY